MKGVVYNNDVLAGYLEKDEKGKFIFRYDDQYYAGKENPPVSLTLPKTWQVHHSNTLFSFFYGLLSVGVNKDIQCRLLKIDERDAFTRLIKMAGNDTIGAITVIQVEE